MLANGMFGLNYAGVWKIFARTLHIFRDGLHDANFNPKLAGLRGFYIDSAGQLVGGEAKPGGQQMNLLCFI